MSAKREGLSEVWNVDIAQALRICEMRYVEVGASEVLVRILRYGCGAVETTKNAVFFLPAVCLSRPSAC